MQNYKTLVHMLLYVSNYYQSTSALNFKYKGTWQSISTETFLESVRRIALGLHSLGVKPKDGIAIIADSSPHWLIFDLAIMINKAYSVPIFANVSSKNFEYQKNNSNIKYIFIHTGLHLTHTLLHNLQSFKKVIYFNPTDPKENGISYQDLLKLGDKLSNEQPQLFAQMRDAVQEHDIATIIYTSGSTGAPKGVEISHKNLISQIKSTGLRFPLDPQKDKVLSCLPLAHVFERMVIYYYFSTGTPIYFVDDIKKVGDILREIKPSVITMVPRLLEKVYAKMYARIEEQTGLKKKIVQFAFARAIDKVPAPNNARDWFFDKLVYRKLRIALGGNLRVLIVGGSALSCSMEKFYTNIGLNIYQGYGLTESSPVLAVNYPGHVKYRSVGKIWPEVEIKITDDHEILARGPNIMLGYHNNSKATAIAIDSEGYLHTGDLGSLDNEGYLTITGRKKEIFKTANGKYVSPVPIEQSLCKSPLIDMAAIIGENRPFVSCLLFPDYENLNSIRLNYGCHNMTDTEFLNSDTVKKEILAQVNTINAQLNAWEKIHKFKFVKQAITIESGELTPTMKLRRHIIETKFSKIIDDFYV